MSPKGTTGNSAAGRPGFQCEDCLCILLQQCKPFPCPQRNVQIIASKGTGALQQSLLGLLLLLHYSNGAAQHYLCNTHLCVAIRRRETSDRHCARPHQIQNTLWKGGPALWWKRFNLPFKYSTLTTLKKSFSPRLRIVRLYIWDQV